MSGSSVQDNSNNIEAFPMTIFETKALNLPKSETSRSKYINEGKGQQQHQGCKVSWANVRPQNRGLLDSSFTDENSCPTCGNKSRNKPVYQIGRMSLPLNGRYANNFNNESLSEANGVRPSTTVPYKDVRNGGKSHLLRSQSGNIYCCGSSVNQLFQNRVPEMPWSSKGDYFVAVLTYLLAFGNVVRFPQLCFKHGGGAFFIPYFIMLIIEGIPLVCLEMAVGQRLGRNSVIESWKDLSPSLRGIGVAATLMSLITIFYYNYIVAWCLYYFVHSMRSSLVWSECPTVKNNGTETLVPECSKSSPAEYYWYRKTLNVADDIDNSTGINMYLYLFVVVSWTLSFILSMRGSRRASKVMIVVLIFIITNLVTFFFRGVHLEGWAQGLARLFIPEMERLKDPVVWMDAAGQIFYSLGVGFGTLTLFSTGNKPKNSCYTDALMCALGNCGTSVWASIIMFSFFGFKADYTMRKCEMDRNASCSKEEIFDQLPPGLSLGFAGLSETFTEMAQWPQLWSSLFYFLLFLLGSSSMLGMIEIVLTTFKELKIFKRTWRNEVICGIFCVALCISNLLFVQSTGFYLLEIISSASSIPLLLTGLAECIGVSFVYGMDRFSKDLKLMMGKRVKSRWQICWKFISPVIILGVIIGGIVQMVRAMADGEFTYTSWDRNQAKVKYRPYPAWGYVVYMVFVLVPLICIIYPPIKDCVMRSRLDPEQTADNSGAIDCEACWPGCVSRSRTYNLSPISSPRINGHVNQTIEDD